MQKEQYARFTTVTVVCLSNTEIFVCKLIKNTDNVNSKYRCHVSPSVSRNQYTALPLVEGSGDVIRTVQTIHNNTIILSIISLKMQN